MRSRFTFAVCAAALAVGIGPARADLLTPTSQSRSTGVLAQVEFSEGSDSHSGGDSAPDYGPFSSAVDAAAGLNIGNSTVGANASSTQDSSIWASGAMCSGTTGAATDGAPGFATNAGAESYFNIEFDITDANVMYTLSGEAGVDDANQAAFGLNLFDADFNTFGQFDASAPMQTFAYAGALPMGHYTLYGDATAFGADGTSGHATFTFTLELTQVPEPAAAFGLLGVALAAGRRR